VSVNIAPDTSEADWAVCLSNVRPIDEQVATDLNF
jgi:hypothetical protein